VYEGELEGASNVAQTLLGKAIRTLFIEKFPNPEKAKKSKKPNPYAQVLNWFNDGYSISLLNTASNRDYEEALNKVEGLSNLVETSFPKLAKADKLLMMEFVLHGLSEFSQLSKHPLRSGFEFKDLMISMFDLRAGKASDMDEN
jgi:magnesium chelatase subunit I